MPTPTNPEINNQSDQRGAVSYHAKNTKTVRQQSATNNYITPKELVVL